VITGNATGATTLTANGVNSSQVASWVSDETGTGSLVFGTNATLVNPAIGTPISGNLSNCNGTAGNLIAGNISGVLGVANGGTGFSSAQIMHVRDEKSAGTAGGTSTSSTAHTRTLNTVVTNTITGASLASNKPTLPAGTYEIEFSSPCYNGGVHRARLYNTTDAANVLIGSGEYTVALLQTYSNGKGIVTISGTKDFELRHYIAAGQATSGLGVPLNIESIVEIYASVFIRRIA
jgi:hypothetical protein